jgi:hypothetical protein
MTIFAKCFAGCRYDVLLKSAQAVIVVTASVEDERGGQGHTSASLLHQSAKWHRALNTHCFTQVLFWQNIYVQSWKYLQMLCWAATHNMRNPALTHICHIHKGLQLYSVQHTELRIKVHSIQHMKTLGCYCPSLLHIKFAMQWNNTKSVEHYDEG